MARRKDPLEATVLGQFGTLGGGNHFIELCIDETGGLWPMLHSGSRGIGNTIGRYFVERAREEMACRDVHLPDRDLAYLPGRGKRVRGLHPRRRLGPGLRRGQPRRNTASHSCGVAPPPAAVPGAGGNGQLSPQLRRPRASFRRGGLGHSKGAVRAGKGELGIIPGMGARSYIVRGKGKPESFMSCAHGAGRAMSRGEAKRRFTVADHTTATVGTECRNDKSVIDETPAADTPIEAVMAAQSDLVDIAPELKQVLCVKG